MTYPVGAVLVCCTRDARGIQVLDAAYLWVKDKSVKKIYNKDSPHNVGDVFNYILVDIYLYHHNGFLDTWVIPPGVLRTTEDHQDVHPNADVSLILNCTKDGDWAALCGKYPLEEQKEMLRLAHEAERRTR